MCWGDSDHFCSLHGSTSDIALMESPFLCGNRVIGAVSVLVNGSLYCAAVLIIAVDLGEHLVLIYHAPHGALPKSLRSML